MTSSGLLRSIRWFWVANREFTIWPDTAGAMHVELGDARLVLRPTRARLRCPRGPGDAIPMHLLTLDVVYFRI
jgi:hypothetical protein